MMMRRRPLLLQRVLDELVEESREQVGVRQGLEVADGVGHDQVDPGLVLDHLRPRHRQPTARSAEEQERARHVTVKV